MAKEKSDKKEKKEKKEKRSDTEGVTKKSKKDKKEKKEKSQEQIDALLKESKPAKAVESESKTNGVKEEEDAEMDDKPRVQVPKEALVPFANPLADDKQTKKLLKSVRKAAKHKTLKRGVKEVVKAIRKGETAKNTSSSAGVVVLAADISPMDVISHIPVLCEDHNIPYIYVTSRAELGAAGNTKRPTSVVMISKDKLKKKGAEADGEAQQEYTEIYSDLVKLVLKAGATVKV